MNSTPPAPLASARSRAALHGWLIAFALLFSLTPAEAANLNHGGPAGPTGENSRQVALTLPPGVGGVEPGLSLVYSHRRGMGELGFGWSMPTSSITLDLSTPDPLSNPTWLLDGVKLLPGPNGSLLPEVDDGRTVVPVLSAASPGFKVFDRAGWTFEYGVGSGTVRSCLAGPCQTVEARLTRAIDPHGLAVAYEYDPMGSSGQAHLERIRWTLDDATGKPVGPERRVEIRYQPLLDDWTEHRGQTRELRYAVDAIDVWVDDERVRTFDLHYDDTNDGGLVLSEIEEVGGGEGSLSRSLGKFEYAPDGLNWSQWVETSWDDAVANWPVDCEPVVQISQNGAVTTDRFDLTGDGISDLVWAEQGDLQTCTADVALAPGMVQDPAWTVDGAGPSVTGLEDVDALRSYSGTGVDLEFMDFDGDGHVDRMRRACREKEWEPEEGCDPGLFFARQVGHLEFAFPVDVTPPGADVRPEDARPAGPTGSEQVGLADVTGDGLPDWVEVDAAAGVWKVWRNAGGEFPLAAEAWAMPMGALSQTLPALVPPTSLDASESIAGLVDVTGDGIVDAVRAKGDCSGVPATGFCRWSVQPGTGYGFEPPFFVDIPFTRAAGLGDVFPLARLYPPLCPGQPVGIPGVPPACTPSNHERRGVHITDLDGDGLGDLVFGEEVAFNIAGRGFSEPVFADLPSEAFPETGPIHSHSDAPEEVYGRYQDHDGDGLVDWVTGDGWFRSAHEQKKRLPPHVMTAAILQTGGRVEYGYEPMIGFAEETNLRVPGQSEPIGPLWLLSSVTYSQGDVGDLRFSYRNPVAWDRAFQGFGEATTHRADGSEATTWFHVGAGAEFLAGLPWRSEGRAPDGSLLTSSESDWGVKPVWGGRVRVLLTDERRTLHGASGEEWTRSTSTKYDSQGRVKDIEAFDHGGSLTTRTSLGYLTVPHPLASNLQIDHLDDIEVWGPTEQLESIDLDLNPVTGDLLERRRWLDTDGQHHPESWQVDAYGYPTRHTDLMGAETHMVWSPDYLQVDLSNVASWPGGAVLPPGAPTPTPTTHRRVVEFDVVTGGAARVEARNQSKLVGVSEQHVDELGRLKSTAVLSPDGSTMLINQIVSWAADERWVEVRGNRFRPDNQLDGQSLRRTHLDPFGRVEQVRSAGDDAGNHLVTWIERDLMGRAVRRSHPILQYGFHPTPWAAQTATEVDYAADGRTRSSWTAGVAPNEPNDWQLSSWDVPQPGEVLVSGWSLDSTGAQIESRTWLDGAGRLSQSEDVTGSPTTFEYDEAGRVTATVDAHGNTTWAKHDSWGRRTMLADPGLSQCVGSGPYDPRDCPQVFEWNLDGTLDAKTDAMGHRREWAYDELGRVAWATAGCEPQPGLPCADPGEGTSFFFYDGHGSEPGHGAWELGDLTAVFDPSGWTEVFRDNWGRAEREVRMLGGQRFESGSEYDSWGAVRSSWVSGAGSSFEPVTFEYDTVGRLEAAIGEQSGVEWVSSVAYDPLDGALTGWESLGGAVTHDFEYGTDGRLRGLSGGVRSGGPTGVLDLLVDLEIDFNPAGLVSTKTSLEPTVTSEEYLYDPLGRLTDVGGATAGYARDYGYDALGNLTWNSAWLDSGDATYEYGSSANATGAGPHSVQNIGAHSGFAYDANGAATERWHTGAEPWSATYRYGSDGQLRSMTRTDDDTGIKTDTVGLVDAFGTRVARFVEVDGVPTSEMLRPNPSIELRDGVLVRTIWAGGQRIAETSATVVDPSSTATFFWEDHQGQQVAAAEVEDLLGAAPKLISRSQVRRDPWGAPLDGDDSLLSRAASGGEPEAGGETWLGWRLYDPEVGRFLQPDTLSSGVGQGMNRTRYGWNSPSNFTDPSGHWEEPLAPPAMGRLAGDVTFGGAPGAGVFAGPVTSGFGMGFSEFGEEGPRWMCVGGSCFVAGMGVEGEKPKDCKTLKDCKPFRWYAAVAAVCATPAFRNHPWCRGSGGGGGGSASGASGNGSGSGNQSAADRVADELQALVDATRKGLEDPAIEFLGRSTRFQLAIGTIKDALEALQLAIDSLRAGQMTPEAARAIGLRIAGALVFKGLNKGFQVAMRPIEKLPVPGSRRHWRVTKEGTERTVGHGRFGKFSKSKSDGLWWSKDQAGHGGSRWKVYRETDKGLVWQADADEFGDFIDGKHKGDTGLFIPWSDLGGG